jgi:sec-independent protein translocase protein TatC
VSREQLPPDSTDEDASIDREQPLLEHLIELRQRLITCVVSVLLVFLVLMIFASSIYSFFITPIISVLPEGSSMLATGTVAPFLTPFKLTFYLSLYVSVPVLLHQLWAFVSPGLYQREKRFAFPLLVASSILFYCGMAFAYFVVLPLLFAFMAGIEIPGVTYMPDISDNLSLMLKLFFAFGVAFEVPVATVLLIRSGVTTADNLARKRPYIIVGCFVVGMLLTPPDVISQVLLAVPMWLLFEVGVWLGRMTGASADMVSTELKSQP